MRMRPLFVLVPLFVWMHVSHSVVWNVFHPRVLYLVDGVWTNQGHASPLYYQNDVVAFQEAHKTCPRKDYKYTAQKQQTYNYTVEPIAHRY